MKQKTLLVVAPYFPPHSGGVERYVYEISRRIAQGEWNVVVLTTSDSKKEYTEEVAGMRVYRLAPQFKVSNTPFSLSWLWRVRRIMRDERPSLVHVHTPVPGLGDLAAFFARVPLVVTYHAGSMRKGKFISDMVVGAYETVLLPFMLRKAAHIFCSSDFVRTQFLGGYMDKSSTCTPAVDAEMFTSAPTRSSRPTILFVAGLNRSDQHKGLSLLIEAVAKLKRTMPDLQLTVVGDGDMREEYAARGAERGLQNNLIFKGILSGSALADAYRSASVFVLPTTNDSFPMVILEAMSCGLPVVSTRVGGIPTLVEEGKTGFLVEPSVDALAEKISLLLHDAELSKNFGERARAKVLAHFSWDERAALCQQVYLKVLARSVVHVSAFYPPHLGGMEQRVKELATLQAHAGVRVRVLTSNQDAPTGTYWQDGVQVTYLRSQQYLHTPVTFGLITQLWRAPRHTLLHLHVAHAFFAEVTAAMARLRGIPYIAHVRMLFIPSGRVGKILLPMYSRFVLRWVLRGAAQIIVLTPGYKTILIEDFAIPEERIRVIPNATSFALMDTSRSLSRQPLRMLAVGRLSVQKNYPFLINVAETLLKQHKLDFALTIVGSGEERAQLEHMVHEKNLQEHVCFVGVKGGKELEEIYEASDLFILASLMEGFSTVLLEAMAKGLPIVASNVIGTRDVIVDGRNGFLVDLHIEKTCEAIVQLATDEDIYRQISVNNLADVRTYAWDSILDKTLQTYAAV